MEKQKNEGIMNLKEYLKIVVDMEKNIYLQNEMIKELQNRCNSLGHMREFAEPTIPVLPPTNRTDTNTEKNTDSGFSKEALIGIALCIVGLCTLPWGLLLLIPGAIMTIMSLSAMAHNVKIDNKLNADYSERYSRYVLEKEAYNQRIADDQKRVNRENLKKKILQAELTNLRKQHTKTQANLKQIYALDIIKPRYRDLVSVSSLYDYISDGICSELEGNNGAYKMYIEEQRANRIIAALEDFKVAVVSQLQEIQQNQYTLYRTAQETNQYLKQVNRSILVVGTQLHDIDMKMDTKNIAFETRLENIQKNSMITAYCTEQLQKELKYMNRMNYLAGRNDRTFFNLPPA